jgi:hypothetical protein
MHSPGTFNPSTVPQPLSSARDVVPQPTGPWFGLQVIQGTSELASPGLAAGIAWWAHIGGFAFGAAFAVIANRFKLDEHTSTVAGGASHGKRVPDIKSRSWHDL